MKTPHKLKQWATLHGVTDEALQGLLAIMIPDTVEATTSGDAKSESFVQSNEMISASRRGGRLWRNNVGVLPDKYGRPVRYGLCNESKEVNKICKSSDLIGIQPILITEDMVGSTIGQFVAREAKKQGWRYVGNDHEVGQLNFLSLVIALGGDGQFVNTVDDHV